MSQELIILQKIMDMMEMMAEQQYYICLLEMGVSEDDL